MDIFDKELKNITDSLKASGMDVCEKKLLSVNDFANAMGMIFTNPVLMSEVLSKEYRTDMLMSFVAMLTVILFDKGDCKE